MGKNYKLSVVVLVYNTEPYLRDCFDSLVNQTLSDIEIIIVNDESPDNSLQIIEEYQSKYQNIKVINQKNSGGAIAGNKGIRLASGEYVALMDSDDIVPLDAYEKLYNKAKECNAEIVLGRANILMNGVQKPVAYKKEREVWKQERIISDLYQYLDIFYDAFYWNKIFNREFILKYDCLMPPGMLYADRPMVHKAFLYANKIAIITDLVYLWRKRGEEAAQKSISQTKTEINNFLDRVESYNYQINYFNDFGDMQLKNEFLKRNIDRLLFPIGGIIEDVEFRDVYLKELKGFFTNVENIYSNDLGIVKNIYIYLILNDEIDVLLKVLQSEKTGEVIEENGIYYWALPYFRESSYKIPDEFFQLKEVKKQYVNIEKIEKDNQFIRINNINVPDSFLINKVTIEVESRVNLKEKLVYEVKRDKNNILSARIPIGDFSLNYIYDFYVVFYNKEREERFRITKKMLETKFKKMEFFDGSITRRLFFEGGKLSFLVTDIQLETLRLDENQVSIGVRDPNVDTDLTFFLKVRGTKEKIYFHSRENGHFELPWNQFIEPNLTYDFFIRIYKKSVRLNIRNFSNYHGHLLVVEDTYTELYKTDKDNISLKTSTSFRRKLRKLLGKS